MDAQRLQQYLHTHIPLSKAMGVEVIEATPERVRLSAPLAPNINHRETAFGGSVSALALLAAWALVTLRLDRERLDARVVVQRNRIEYARPIRADFTATASAAGIDWLKFANTLRRRGRARLVVGAILESGGTQAGALEGDFVAATTRQRP